MTKNTMLNLGVLAAISTACQAANIVLVTDFETTTDADFVTYLTDAGHSVTSTNRRYRDLDATKIGELNAADLVIVSRNTDSGSYAGTGEVAQWDAITTTIWLGSAYLATDSRWQFTTGTSITSYNGDITAQNATAGAHPIYSGLTSAGTGHFGENKYKFTKGTNVVSGNDNLAGTGTVLGVRNNTTSQYIIAAEWDAGATTGSGNTLAGDRFYFALPNNFADNTRDDGNTNGLKMIDNTIGYLVPEPSSIALLGLGGLALILRRRK